MIILEKIICIAQDKPFICVVTKSIRKGLIEPTVFNKTFSYGFSILNDIFEDSIMKTMLTMPQLSKKEAENIAVCYDKLWKLMIDKKINKTQLCEKTKITTNAMAKLERNEDVRVETLVKICNVLNCDFIIWI